MDVVVNSDVFYKCEVMLQKKTLRQDFSYVMIFTAWHNKHCRNHLP